VDPFDLIGATPCVGFDWMDLAKGAANLASGAGGVMSQGGKAKKDDKAEAEKKKLEEDKRKAEEAAARSRTILVGVGAALAAALGAVVLLRR